MQTHASKIRLIILNLDNQLGCNDIGAQLNCHPSIVGRIAKQLHVQLPRCHSKVTLDRKKRALEMVKAGIRGVVIARELGVSRQAVSLWLIEAGVSRKYKNPEAYGAAQ